MSVWSNHECFDELPERDPTEPLDDDPPAYSETDEAEWAAFGDPSVQMTEAEVQASLAGAPESPPPTDADLELMAAYYARHWRWDQPF